MRGYGETRLREDLPPDAPAQRRVEVVTFHEVASGGAGDSATESPVSEAPGRSGGMTQEPVGGSGVVRVRRDGESTADDAREEERGEDGAKSGYVAIQ